jgi:hypothetical protein
MTTNVPQDLVKVQNLRMDLAQTMREAATLDDAFRALNQFIENRDQRAGGEAVLYARSNELAEPILQERSVMLTAQNVPDDIYDAPPQANALVAAAYRKAAEMLRRFMDDYDIKALFDDSRDAARKIGSWPDWIEQSCPADAEAALREVCMRVAEDVNAYIEDDFALKTWRLEEIVNSVLGEGWK